MSITIIRIIGIRAIIVVDVFIMSIIMVLVMHQCIHANTNAKASAMPIRMLMLLLMTIMSATRQSALPLWLMVLSPLLS